MNICQKNTCTGCFACVNSCPKSCISMEPDPYGELHPVIKDNLCIKCNKCINVCPNNKKSNSFLPIEFYAAWINDKIKRKECASGGIGTALSEFFIKEYKGVVYGTKYNDNLEPVVSRIDDIDSLKYLKGSKYVQSIIGNSFINIEKDLKDGLFVLFIGTPCQISGLHSFLRNEYDKIFLVDLICHGVSPTSYFLEEISFLKKKYNLDSITNCRFRGNDNNDYKFTLWNNKKIIFKRSNQYQYYFSAFLQGISLRENCYSCKYAIPERISDITIGDFIGLGDNIPFPYSRNNVSCVSINTLKGKKVFSEFSFYDKTLELVPREYCERLNYKESLLIPYPRSKYNKRFRKLYPKYGWAISIRKVLWFKIFKLYVFNHFILLMKLPFKVAKRVFNSRTIMY